jgi:Zn-dependent protease
MADMQTSMIKIGALVISIILHEIAHGYVAYRLGDPTARDAKRLTLNPLAHIDLFGSIILPLFLVITKSSVLLGWAKPVPFNPGYFRDPKKGIMLVGVAGPATNLLLAVIAAALIRLMPFLPGGVILFLFYMCVVNVMLAMFNLIPIPPLDGSRVVIGLLPPHAVRQYLSIERYGFLIIFGLLYLGLFDAVVLPISQSLLVLLLG